MPIGVCAICSNAEICQRVNGWLESGEYTQQQIAEKIGITDSSVSRHKINHFHRGQRLGFFNESNGDRFCVVYDKNAPLPNFNLRRGAALWIVTVDYEPEIKLPEKNVAAADISAEEIPAEIPQLES